MKTIKNIAGFVCISLLLSGCVENYDVPSKTEKGKAIYNSWHKGMDTLLSRYIDVAFKFNTWYEAADSQKNSVEDKYFPQFKIRDLQNDQWGLFSGTELAYRISRYSKSLSDPNACWIIEAMNEAIDGINNNNNQDYYYSDGGYKLISFLEDAYTPVVLSAMGVNQWDIQVGESHSEDMISIQLKSMDSITPVSLLESSFTISTEGTFVYLEGYNYQYGNIVYIDFKTMEDLVYRRRDKSGHSQEGDEYLYPKKTYYWSAGKVSLHAIDEDNDNETLAEASFSQLTRSQFGIYITYKGITEEWIENNR